MKKLILTALVAASALTASAVPAKRGPYTAYTVDGKEIMVQRVGDEHGSWFLDMQGNLMRHTAAGFEFARFDSDGLLVKSDTPLRFSRSMVPAAATQTSAMRRSAAAIGRFPGNSFPVTGKQKAIVVLVEFADVKFHLGDNARSYFTDMLSKEGFNEYDGTGCAHEYFLEMSSGNFDCDFNVYGPVTLKNNMEYYGGNNDANAYKMAIEACDALDSTVDFADYDRNNDGYIDNVFIFYAGLGEATAYPEEKALVWPHAWNVTAAERTRHTYDGKILDSYGCTNEWIEEYRANNRSGYTKVDEYPDGVGTFVHEFSHILGLPDLYYTDKYLEDIYFTPGEWSVLDYGPYNNNGRTPPAYSAFERNALGWMTPEELTADIENPSLTHIEESNHAYSICNPKDATEFYLLECRKRSGWDKYIPSDGMLVWHIDYDSANWTENTVNNTRTHQYVDLVEADGTDYKVNRNAGDCFPGTKKVTSLSTKWWDKTSTGIKLSNITLNADKTVSFDVEGPADITSPDSWLSVVQVIDTPMSGDAATVRGYIVGHVKAGTFNQSGVVFGAGSVNTNLVLADAPSEADITYCIPVQLLKNTTARTDLNLKDNPAMLGKKVELYGTLDTYMQVPALKNVSSYKLLDEKADDDENTSIEEILIDSSAPLFDLQGRRVSQPKPGVIYIRAGKKIRY